MRARASLCLTKSAHGANGCLYPPHLPCAPTPWTWCSPNNQPAGSDAAAPLPLRDRVKVLGLALVTLALLCTKAVKLGPDRDPLIDPSIDPNNLQGLQYVVRVWCGARKFERQGGQPVGAVVWPAQPHTPSAVRPPCHRRS